MAKRTLSCLVFLLFQLSSSFADDLTGQGEQALSNGDSETALAIYMELLEANPGDLETAEIIVFLAEELGIPELAADVLIQQVELSMPGSKAALPGLFERISSIHVAVPAEFDEQLQSLSIVEDVDVMETLMELQSASQSAFSEGDLQIALEHQESFMQVAQEVLGEEHWLSVVAMRDMGSIYNAAQVAEEAEAFYLQALESARGLLGDTHPATLEIAGLIVELYYNVGAFQEALAINEMVIGSYEEILGPYHALTRAAQISTINLLQNAGAPDDAINVLADVCGVTDQGYGEHHPTAIECLSYLAGLTLGQEQLAIAESMYLDVIRRLADSSATIDGIALNNISQLAEVYRKQGRYQESSHLLSKVIQTAAQMGETEASYTARSHLARVFSDEGALENAEQVTNEVLDYGLQYWQDEPTNIFNTMLELGAIYQARGFLAEAEATFEEAWMGLLDTVGETHASTLVAMNNLGQIYEKQGLYDLAEPMLKQTLDDMEAVFGIDNPQSSRARNNLALLYESQGNFREAEPLYKKSLEVLSDALGETHTDTIAVRNNLAFLYMLMEEYKSAGDMFVSILEQWTVLFGEDHQSSLKAMNNLGRVYQRLNHLEQAEQLVLRALELRRSNLGEAHLDSIRSMIDLGDIYREQGRLEEADDLLTDAVAIAESSLSEQHPYTFEALRNLARVKEARGMADAAVQMRGLAFNRRRVFLDRMLWVTGENAREGYLRLHREEFNEYLSLLTKIDSADAGKRVIDASLQRKGLLLKITSEIQQISKIAVDPKMAEIAAELGAARRELAAMTLSGPTVETQGRHVEVLYALEQQVNELQGELGRASARYRTSIAQVSVESLATVLPEGSAFVDYLTFEDDGKKKILAGTALNDGGEVSYGLVVYEDRDDVENIIIEYRTIIQDELADEDELLEIGQIAYEKVWEPVLETIGDTPYVYLIPDGTLNILPFNALISIDEEYLIQTHDLHILTSGRDLLPNEYNLAQGEYLIVAGPDYDSEDVLSREELDVAQGKRSAALKLGIRGVGGGLRGLSFAPLPGAEREGRIITDQLQENEEASAMFFGQQAQEIVLADITEPPEILHLATHGFFLEADDTLLNRILKAQRSADIHVPPPGDNPLLRAGLAFAGINNNAQFLGDIDTVNDGVLTALEVLDLNISGTRLVVLSACETGLGEIHEGEGVYGLRRSFQEAGVAEVVSSLWEVSDAGTQALMTDFYERILQGVPARDALRETQLEMLDSPEWGYPYVWSAFMIVGNHESADVTIQ